MIDTKLLFNLIHSLHWIFKELINTLIFYKMIVSIIKISFQILTNQKKNCINKYHTLIIIIGFVTTMYNMILFLSLVYKRFIWYVVIMINMRLQTDVNRHWWLKGTFCLSFLSPTHKTSWIENETKIRKRNLFEEKDFCFVKKKRKRN